MRYYAKCCCNMRLFILLLLQIAVLVLAVEGRVIDFELDVGAIADDFTGAQFSC